MIKILMTFAADHFIAAKIKVILTIIYRTRYEVKTPSFIGHIIENNKIGIYNLTKGIGSLVSGNIQPVYLQIKSIEYRYPDSQTKLEIGNFLYDSFDLENSLVEDVRQVPNPTSFNSLLPVKSPIIIFIYSNNKHITC